MKPLHPIALGLVVIALQAPVGDHDLLADPVGWLLVLIGTARVPAPAHRLRPALVAAALAGAVSVALYVPSVGRAVVSGDPSLNWAVNLPQIAYALLVCQVLVEMAREPDPRAARWLRTAQGLQVLVVVGPVLVFGAGLDRLEEPTYLLAAGAMLLLISLLLIYGNRSWAMVPRQRHTPEGS